MIRFELRSGPPDCGLHGNVVHIKIWIAWILPNEKVPAGYSVKRQTL